MLSLEERLRGEIMRDQDVPVAEIARQLGRSR
jgi:IS30 family transposase